MIFEVLGGSSAITSHSLFGDMIMFFARSIVFITVGFGDVKCNEMSGNPPKMEMHSGAK
jgi:hypothetical protein